MDLGHKLEEKQNNVPVAVVHLSRTPADPGTRQRVNGDVGFLHDANDYGANPPSLRITLWTVHLSIQTPEV